MLVPDLDALAAGLEDRLEEVAVGVGVINLAVADFHPVALAYKVVRRLVNPFVAVLVAAKTGVLGTVRV